MEQYRKLVNEVLEHGIKSEDRTGVGTISRFGHQSRFDLSQGFPLLTLKKTHFRSIVHELLWFLQGSGNISYLTENNVHIWDEWADENGDLGPVYGKQWRSWPDGKGGTIDQIGDVINMIKRNPNSRRLMVTAWNPAEIDQMALPPCHTIFQFYVREGKLSCQLYQRSADIGLGVPFNIASYALLTHIIAKICKLEVGDFIHTFGDAHIYLNHVDALKEVVQRPDIKLPTISINPNVHQLSQLTFDDITLHDYEYHPAVKLEIAI